VRSAAPARRVAKRRHAANKGDEFAPLHGLPQNMREASLSLCDRRRVRNGTQPIADFEKV
jgi:hypothetical protein